MRSGLQNGQMQARRRTARRQSSVGRGSVADMSSAFCSKWVPKVCEQVQPRTSWVQLGPSAQSARTWKLGLRKFSALFAQLVMPDSQMRSAPFDGLQKTWLHRRPRRKDGDSTETCSSKGLSRWLRQSVSALRRVLQPVATPSVRLRIDGSRGKEWKKYEDFQAAIPLKGAPLQELLDAGHVL